MPTHYRIVQLNNAALHLLQGMGALLFTLGAVALAANGHGWTALTAWSFGALCGARLVTNISGG